MKPISDAIRAVGASDADIRLFEGQYLVPDGMAYNSYVILDEKIAVMDTVDERFGELWLQNLRTELNGRSPDYLVVQHMEPDHSSNITRFADAWPDAQIVSSQKAFVMMKNYYGTDYADRRIVISEGSTLPLGTHTLCFASAPMVHWPEVMVTYEASEHVLFSADGFGKFGALEADQPWADEARRYYFGIVGKFGVPVQALLKKAAALDVRTVCPLHGPVLTGDLTPYLKLYDTWSAYRPEVQGVCIAYTSVYGHTRDAAEELAQKLRARGVTVALHDLAAMDQSPAIADAFRYDRLVLATTTYNGNVFPFMHNYLHALSERGFRGRRVGLIENGSWAPLAAKGMTALLEECKDLTFAASNVRILSALNDDSREQLDRLCEEMAK